MTLWATQVPHGRGGWDPPFRRSAFMHMVLTGQTSQSRLSSVRRSRWRCWTRAPPQRWLPVGQALTQAVPLRSHGATGGRSRTRGAGVTARRRTGAAVDHARGTTSMIAGIAADPHVVRCRPDFRWLDPCAGAAVANIRPPRCHWPRMTSGLPSDNRGNPCCSWQRKSSAASRRSGGRRRARGAAGSRTP